ncbi:hypothetical protein ABQG65_08720 [Yersinia alsatica]|uniref:YdcA family protein n=1 Tax=Yersinia alsatica TaxID=2890317 RepID=UPI0032EAB03C
MIKLLSILIVALTLTAEADASRGRKPCSGSKGGVSHCTSDGRFLCNDGTISKSKKICSSGRSNYSSTSTEYQSSKKVPVSKSSKLVQKKQHILPINTASSLETSEQQATQPKVPICAPLHMAAQPGYTHLPICQVDGKPYE